MKHMAFKEEQECRIVYVTQMDNPLIQYDEKINRIYIDYAPSVGHLEKIYIAPKAKDEKMVFEYLFARTAIKEIRKGKEAVKVKISQNPFRMKIIGAFGRLFLCAEIGELILNLR